MARSTSACWAVRLRVLLLSIACSYDANANVDLTLTRKPFDQVAGLNGNGIAVGTGLDSYYNVNLTGGAATMFGNLFLMTNAANYNIALNMLSGSVYANYLNSFPSLGVHENDLTDHATNCEIPALAGSVLECRSSAADPRLGSARLSDSQGQWRQ